MNKGILATILCAMLAAFALGATGTACMPQDAERADDHAGRLVGVLLTKAPLDIEDKLPATLKDGEYAFAGTDGALYAAPLYASEESTYRGVNGDSIFTDRHSSIHSSDSGDSLSLLATIYHATTGKDIILYANPVFQAANGEVYAERGNAMMYADDTGIGTAGSHEISENTKTTVDGKEEVLSSVIKLSVCFVERPAGIAIVQYGGDGAVLARAECAQGALPDSVSVAPGTEYILVETRAESGNVTRELYQKDAQALFALTCREDGVCTKQYCEIIW